MWKFKFNSLDEWMSQTHSSQVIFGWQNFEFYEAVYCEIVLKIMKGLVSVLDLLTLYSETILTGNRFYFWNTVFICMALCY